MTPENDQIAGAGDVLNFGTVGLILFNYAALMFCWLMGIAIAR